jgi:YD repeat-containing protein
MYDANGNLTSVSDIREIPQNGEPVLTTTVYVYDTLDRLAEVINPEGNKVVYTRNAEGLVTDEVYKDRDGNVVAHKSYGYAIPHRMTSMTEHILGGPQPQDPVTTIYGYNVSLR